MEIKLEPISTGEPFAGTVTTPDTALTQRDALIADCDKLTAVTNEQELEIAVALLRDVNAMLKITEDSREKHKKPFWDMGKLVDSFAAKFRTPLEKPKDRISGLVNHFQRKQIEAKNAAEVKALNEARAAQKQAEAAAKAIADAEKKGDVGALLDAQLKAEEAAMTQQVASAVLTATTNTPRGLVTKVSYDFQIIYPLPFANHAAAVKFWESQDDNETLKIDRQAIIKALNHESGHPWLPPEGQDSVTHPFGVRVYVSVKSHVR